MFRPVFGSLTIAILIFFSLTASLSQYWSFCLNIDPFASVYLYKFNTEAAPLNNVNIRKALTYAINREAIVKNITQAEQLPAMGLVPPAVHGAVDCRRH